jgi:hypothetical protein
MRAVSDPTRREFLQWIGAGTAILLLPPGCGSSAFFSDGERRTLGALANAILPPDDTAGGAALGAVEYIEALLTAFDHSPPRIFVGGPYSGRAPFPDDAGGAAADAPPNGFLTPLALDRVAERAWRLKLYGSSGVDGGGPNDALLGPVVGLRDTIKQAIAQAQGAAGKTPVESLDADALAALYAGLDADYRDALVALVSEGAFGAPEYGGNPGGAGWTLVHFPGDQMPLGYSLYDAAASVYRERSDAPVTTADPGADPEPLDDTTRAFLTQLVQTLGGKQF